MRRQHVHKNHGAEKLDELEIVERSEPAEPVEKAMSNGGFGRRRKSDDDDDEEIEYEDDEDEEEGASSSKKRKYSSEDEVVEVPKKKPKKADVAVVEFVNYSVERNDLVAKKSSSTSSPSAPNPAPAPAQVQYQAYTVPAAGYATKSSPKAFYPPPYAAPQPTYYDYPSAFQVPTESGIPAACSTFPEEMRPTSTESKWTPQQVPQLRPSLFQPRPLTAFVIPSPGEFEEQKPDRAFTKLVPQAYPATYSYPSPSPYSTPSPSYSLPQKYPAPQNTTKLNFLLN